MIEFVRDSSLSAAMGIVNKPTINPDHMKRYKSFLEMSEEQREAVCDLLSETVSDTIFNFLHIFEFRADEMKIIVTDEDGNEHDLIDTAEMLGEGIADEDESGWIPRFSKVGRHVKCVDKEETARFIEELVKKFC